MKISTFDQQILLRMIKTGDFTQVDSMKINFDYFTPAKITIRLKKTDNLKHNYALAKKLADLLTPEDGKIKKNLNDLLAFELGQYDREFEKRKKFTQLNTYISDLNAFPLKKRIWKFLVKFTLASKSLQNLAGGKSNDLEILKIIKNLILGVRNYADS